MESNKDYWPTPSVSMYPPAGNTLFKREDVERAIDKSLPPGTIRLNGRIYPVNPTALYSHQREAIEKALGDKALRIQRGLGKARTNDLFRAWYEAQQAKAAIREASANRLQIGRDGMFDNG